MLKKSITYTDFNGNELTEDFYFNLTKAEITEMEMSARGGLEKMIKEIVDAEDGKRIVEVLKEIILKAYGKKSEDGKRFIKSQQISEEFAQTDAFSELFMELGFDATKAADFINAVVHIKGNA